MAAAIGSSARTPSRGASTISALLALVFASTTLTTGLASDRGVLASSVALAAALFAVALWRSGSFESRFGAALLGTGVLGGQLLTALVGLPVGPAPHWNAATLLSCVLAAGLLATLAFDARRHTRPGRTRPPYAL